MPFLTAGSHLIEGPAGAIEILVDLPSGAEPKGLALVTHPQPLLGGNAQHKIPHFLAKGLATAGWWVVRPNFRGVGRSEGTHDAGIGETDDLLHLLQSLRPLLRERPLALVGFSFGAFVQARVAAALQTQGHPAHKVCLAGMPYGQLESGRAFDTPQDIRHARVIHGELDEIVPLKLVFDWARPAAQVISVVPGADHFFSGRLPLLRSLVLDFLEGTNHS